MEVYKSRFLELKYFEEYKLIEMTWTHETQDMTPQQYKEEFLNYLNVILELKPRKIIPDTRNMDFPITPDLQDWTNETIFVPSLEMGLDKAAFVVSRDMITQISVEQTMQETEGVKFTTRYFDNKEEARTWILAL